MMRILMQKYIRPVKSEDAIILYTYIIPMAIILHTCYYTVVARRLVFHTQYKKSAAV